jgi:circadian clock protein KaiC
MSIAKRPSGIPGLDALLSGGIPRGRTTLVCGKSGAGKTSLALQLLSAGARAGERGVYVCLEEHPDDVLSAGDELGLGLSELVHERSVALLDLRAPTHDHTELAGEAQPSGLVEVICTTAQRIEAHAVVIDSLSSLFYPRPNQESVRRSVLFLVRELEARGFTVVLLSDSPADYSRPSTSGAEDGASLVLIVRNAVDDTRRRRTIEVYKYRRSDHRKGEYPFTISSGGVTIFPVEMTEAGDDGGALAAVERFSSGLSGLDAMNGGGWLRDSIVLVRGPTGSGKTTLAGMYAYAGARRGERIAYYGFEEPRSVLLRNFAQLGLPLHAITGGGVRVVCRYPEATSSEDLLVEMRRDLAQHGPSLVVVDSISAIEHAGSPAAFRSFLIGLASLLRRFERSALLIQTTGAQGEADHEAPYLSTVADAILSLGYTAEATTLHRTMRVLKMRGSAHSVEPWQLELTDHGLSVAPVRREQANTAPPADNAERAPALSPR